MTKERVCAKGPAMSRRTLLTTLPASGVALALPDPIIAEQEETVEPNPVLSLPFVRDATRSEQAALRRPRIFWSVEPSGDYTADCETGAHYASLAIDYMSKNDFSGLLGWAVLDMMLAGPERSGIEIGFLGYFGQLAICSHRQRTKTA